MGKIILYCGSKEVERREYTKKTESLEKFITNQLKIQHSENLQAVYVFLDFIQQLLDIINEWESNENVKIYIYEVISPIYGWEGSRANYQFTVYLGSRVLFNNNINNMPNNCGIAVLQKFSYFVNLDRYYSKDKYDLVLDKYIEFLNKLYTVTSYRAFVITIAKDLEIANDLLKREFQIGLEYRNKENQIFYILNKTFTTKNDNYNYEKLKERIYSSIEDEKPNSEAIKEPVTETSSESSSENRVNNSPRG